MYSSCLNGGHAVGHITEETVPGADVKYMHDNRVERQVEDLVAETMAQVVAVAEAE